MWAWHCGGRGRFGLRNRGNPIDQLPYPVAVPGQEPWIRRRLRGEVGTGRKCADLLHLPGWERLRWGQRNRGGQGGLGLCNRGTLSTNFPTQSPYQEWLLGRGDAFVTKLTSEGNALVYSTYLGGSASEGAMGGAGRRGLGLHYGEHLFGRLPYSVAIPGDIRGRSLGRVRYEADLSGRRSGLLHLPGWKRLRFWPGHRGDRAGLAYVAGYTESANFPTLSAYQAAYRLNGDGFVTRLTPAGDALAYSTYLGGSGYDVAYGVAVDWSGSAYVTGATASTNFPTQSPYQATCRGVDAYVTKLAPAGSALAYSTCLGGGLQDGATGSRWTGRARPMSRVTPSRPTSPPSRRTRRRTGEDRTPS